MKTSPKPTSESPVFDPNQQKADFDNTGSGATSGYGGKLDADDDDDLDDDDLEPSDDFPEDDMDADDDMPSDDDIEVLEGEPLDDDIEDDLDDDL